MANQEKKVHGEEVKQKLSELTIKFKLNRVLQNEIFLLNIEDIEISAFVLNV